jgi:hypothetical protein
MMTAISLDAPATDSIENLYDPRLLRAVADLALSRGDVAFMPGGGLIFDKPLSRDERHALPTPNAVPPRLLSLPEDRFTVALERDPAFRAFVEIYTIPRAEPGYRLVALPLPERLSAGQLRGLADAAETFGHGRVRITARVTLRLTHVPTALLRPLFRSLASAGLLTLQEHRLAA